jgi:hypothetical protein
MKNTLLIAYSGGAYGTYLEWVLNTLINTDEIQRPFTKVGNSHGSNLGHYIDDITKFINKDIDFITARFHPKIKKTQKLQIVLNDVLDQGSRMILIYPDRDHELLCVNNYMTKIWKTDIYQGPLAYCNPDDIYNNYPVKRNTPLDELPRWIQREHISYNLFDSWRDHVEWYFPDSWSHDKCLIVTTKELLFNFGETISKIMDFWQKPAERDLNDLIPCHNEMLSLQQYIGQDALTRKILDSVQEKTYMSWEPLPIASEAWIQKCLRENGIDFKCHGLEIFPTNTEKLLELC